MELPNCSRCNAIRDVSDNFCRKCGYQLTPSLPAVRPVTQVLIPAKPVAIPPSVVRGAALLALTTGAEWLLRRMAGNAAKAAGRSLVPSSVLPSKQVKTQGPQEVSVDEILYVRKVQLRR